MRSSLPTSRSWPFCLALAFVGLQTGCSRTWHRRDADQEVACVIAEKGGELGVNGVYAAPQSRLADPAGIDCPPMPPDDADSHRLMHCIDGKRAFDWDRYGQVADVESPHWQDSLPRNEKGEVVLNLRETVRVSRLNSRDYQNNVETLYLSALDVSFERFRFDRQFFAGTDTFQAHRGRDVGATSPLDVDHFASVERLTASGGELVIGFVNSLMWDFWGADSDVFSSTIDFSLVQPLLRFGGRARVLENLTQSERNLLANVRQFRQFQQGFYVDVITGRDGGPALRSETTLVRPDLGSSLAHRAAEAAPPEQEAFSVYSKINKRFATKPRTSPRYVTALHNWRLLLMPTELAADCKSIRRDKRCSTHKAVC